LASVTSALFDFVVQFDHVNLPLQTLRYLIVWTFWSVP